jgi:hypothetical protein
MGVDDIKDENLRNRARFEQLWAQFTRQLYIEVKMARESGSLRSLLSSMLDLRAFADQNDILQNADRGKSFPLSDKQKREFATINKLLHSLNLYYGGQNDPEVTNLCAQMSAGQVHQILAQLTSDFSPRDY